MATAPVAAGPDEPAAAAPGAQAAPSDPETTFGALERDLLRDPLHLRFDITAEGSVEVSLVGELHLDAEVELSARGRFAGEDHELHLWTEGDRLRLGPVDAPTLDVPRPPELAPALVVGLTRMGLLHNLAMLVAGVGPDHADGGVADWVATVEHHRPSPPPAEGDALTFGLVVSGQPSGRATLWLDAQGMPLRREQVVDFPDGQMRVVERYEVLSSVRPGGG
ncbi:MAG: hypothetical protein KDK70_03145 [Myxococcales bacterium]|nr:hypothetical protein [Myxococcales bacterium]